jgi:diguanylate cyclase (GGDEF)-like protein
MSSVPLIANEELIGAVSLYWTEVSGYGEEHLRLLETIARIAAEAIDKSLEHDEAKTNALTDTMTGLPNARNLQMQFDKEVARASRAGTTFQLLMLDLDGFKAVNDSFGHKVGDHLLRGVGKVIREQLRDYDFLARYGGDEFVILVPDTSLEDVADLCTRIEKGVSDYKLKAEGDKFASVGVSIGSSSYPASGETFDQMIIAADKAMYRRKTRRRQDPTRFAISGINLPPEITARVVENDGLIVELDDSHVIATGSIN